MAPPPEPIDDVALDVKAVVETILKADGEPLASRSKLYRLARAYPPPASLGGEHNVSPRWRNRAEFFAWLEEAQRRSRLPAKNAEAAKLAKATKAERPRAARRRPVDQEYKDPVEAGKPPKKPKKK